MENADRLVEKMEMYIELDLQEAYTRVKNYIDNEWAG